MTLPQTPAGFSFSQYIYNLKKAFEDAFYTNEECPIIKSVNFAPTSQYEADAGGHNPAIPLEKIEPPAIIIDPYDLKIDPSFDEYTQDRNTPHSNTGNLSIYLFVRALVLVINNKNTVTHLRVRQLAFDIAAIITEQSRFSAQVGMSQVTHISELQGQNPSNRLVGWTVQWQHSIELETTDYSNLGIRKAICDLEADAVEIDGLTIEGTDSLRIFPETIDITASEEFDFTITLYGEEPEITENTDTIFSASTISTNTVQFTGTAPDTPQTLYVRIYGQNQGNPIRSFLICINVISN